MVLSAIVFSTTFILFVLEAIIHYNIGYPGKKFVWPPKKDLGIIFGIVGIFSLVNAVLIWGLKKYSITNKYLFF